MSMTSGCKDIGVEKLRFCQELKYFFILTLLLSTVLQKTYVYCIVCCVGVQPLVSRGQGRGRGRANGLRIGRSYKNLQNIRQVNQLHNKYYLFSLSSLKQQKINTTHEGKTIIKS